jgi:hypothetical protein
LLEGLISTGGNLVYDCLMYKEDRIRFFGRIQQEMERDRSTTLSACESLLQDLSERKEVPPGRSFKNTLINSLSLSGGIIGMLEKNLLTLRASAGRYPPLVPVPVSLGGRAEGRDSANEGYVYVRRVTITPTRIIYGPRELTMGNRVLRFDPINFPPEHFIRVVFRDENLERLFSKNMHHQLVQDFVERSIKDGLWIGGL